MNPKTNLTKALVRWTFLVALATIFLAASDASAGPDLGKTVPVRLSTGNRAVAVELRNVALVDRYGDTAAPDGTLFLVASTSWENILPLKTVRDNPNTSTGYKIPNLADHVYLVIDGKKLVRLDPNAGKLPGHLPVRDFSLPELGSTTTGNLVYAVPKDLATAAMTIELRYYDLTNGHFNSPLFGDPPVEAEKPKIAPAQNQVMQIGAFGVSREAEWAGRKAPDGMTFVLVDFRARSVFETEADASAFDPSAKPGTKVMRSTFADWTDWKKYVQLVVDGEYGYLTEPQTELLPLPRFLPDVMTGGRLVFLAPAKATSIELRCDFPNANVGARVLKPAGLTLALEGRRPNLPQRPTIANVDDDFFKVAVTGQSIVSEFAGVVSKGGKFLVLDIEAKNTGRQDEFFQTREQLKFADESGKTLPISDVTFAGIHPPAELVRIPASERRSFQIVFEIPSTTAKPRLAYQGVTLAKVLDLRPIDGGAVATTTQPAAPGTTKPVVAITGSTPSDIKPVTPATTKPAVPAKKDQLPVRVAARQPQKPRGLAAAGLSAEQVNASIDRGSKYLWEATQKEMAGRKNGGLRDHDALYLLALLHAGYDKKDPACEALIRDLLANSNPQNLGPYGAGLYCMIAESFGDAMYLPRVKLAARYLIESQGIGGTWTYNGNTDPKLYELPQPDLTQPLQVIGGTPLEGPGSDQEEMKRLTKPTERYNGDNSCTQYAILGLHSAERMGLKIPKEVWQRAADEQRKRQQPDGGWAYESGGNSYGSMVCAGISSLTLCRYHLGEKEPAVDEAIERGIGWLDVKFSVNENPVSGKAWLYYYLYGLERVGRILDTEFIGDHEWYPFGARFILSQQRDDGSWMMEGQEADPKLPTSFALLFLTRATPNLAIAKRSGPGVLKTEMAAPPMNRIYVILDASGSMLEEMNGKQKFAVAQDAILELLQSLPDNSEVALRVYGHRKSAIAEGADQDTELLVPMSKLDRKKLPAIVKALRCRGKTPMALSLKQAAGDIGGRGDPVHPVTLVLLTDGGEDTIPRQDPVKAAAEIGKLAGVNFQLVGFDINREEWSAQLQAMAQAGKGQYLPAAKADALVDRLKAAVFRTPEGFVVTSVEGKEVARGSFGQSAKLPPGKYTVATTLAGYGFSRELWVNADSTTVARFDPLRVDFSKAARVTPAAQPVPAIPAVPVAKFCTECGKPLVPGAKFCPNCGAKVK